MFDFFRKHNKLMMVALFLLIIPSFVLFGVERYFQGGGKSERVAQVDGNEITRPEWEAQHRNEVDRLRQQAPGLDPAQLDSDVVRYASLERMVRERVLSAAAAKDHMTVTEDSLLRMFAEDPNLASFRKPGGGFDTELFTRVTGRTPEQYTALVRAQLVTQQVLLGVTGSALASPAQAEATFGAAYAQREVQLARFDPAQYAAGVQVSDADLEGYYKEHTAQFQAPEQMSIEYLVLDLEAAKKSVAVNEADLKTYYEQNHDRFGGKEERRASHILIATAAGASAAEREKAKARAEELLAEARKAPASFEELARKNSQDPGSAEKGGALDFVTRGATVKPFEDAMFALKKGETSNVVETEFGYHIIRLDDIRPAVVPPFESVRAQIENDLRAQQAPQIFAKLTETFTDAVYNQADSLKGPAATLNLPIQNASGVQRTPAPDASGVLANRNFLSALYTSDVLERKHNTEAIEIGSNQLVSGRVTQYSPARTLPLAEVKEQVRAQLVAERASALARKDGEAKRAAWEAHPQGATVGAPMLLSRQEMRSQPTPVIEAALRADPAKLPAWVGVDLGVQGYAVLRVNKSVPREAPAADLAKREMMQFTQAVAVAEEEAYYQLLKERYKAEIVVKRPADALPGAVR